MYAEIPTSIKRQIEHLLLQDKFVEAKALYAHWHQLNQQDSPKKMQASKKHPLEELPA